MIDFINFYIHIIMNFDYFHYFFINYLIFIIYKKIYSRFIKNIEKN